MVGGNGHIVLPLDQTQEHGLALFTRQQGNGLSENLGNGTIKDFELYVSRSKADFGDPVYTGEFKKIRDMQTVNFPVTWGEFVRIKILSEINGNTFASAAEFNVTRE